MKTNTQKFIGLLALIFLMSFNANSQEIGDFYQGGYIFQINDDGTGVVAAPSSAGNQTWVNAMANASSYSSGGYNDWYLPSIDELTTIRNTIGMGGSWNSANAYGFTTGAHWSSTQNPAWNGYASNSASCGPYPYVAYIINFYNGSGDYGCVNFSYQTLTTHYVRSVTFETLGCTDATASNYNPNATADDGSCIQAITQDNIHSAVDLWESDQAAAEATYGHISSWDVSAVTNMSNLFDNRNTFNEDISNWDVSNVTDMSYMFHHAESFNYNLNSWDVSSVINMDKMFEDARAFNQDLNNWNVSNVTSMFSMFLRAVDFDGDISQWDVSNVTTMQRMLKQINSNPNISNWDVSNVTNMQGMLSFSPAFDQDLSNWDVSNVTNMVEMFRSSNSFNGDITSWNTSSLVDMSFMFYGASSFNQDISNWDVSNVTKMRALFREANSFNQNINNWDVSSVTNMSYMFRQNAVFNTDISNWDVSSVNTMQEMFNNAASFNQDLSSWNVEGVSNMTDMFLNTNALSDENKCLINSIFSSNENWSYDWSGLCPITGCTDATAYNYDSEANTDDGSCIAVVNGCTDATAFNYNADANTEDGSCVAVVEGCMDETALNYDANANTDDGSCVAVVEGCTDVSAFNYNADANTDDGSCVAVVEGCMDATASNYNADANTNDGSCISWEEFANDLQDQLATAMANQEDGIGQADVDAAAEQAYNEGVASVEVPECEEVSTQNIPLALPQGWSMFGYTCMDSVDAVTAFSEIADKIEIVKDEWGLAYITEWGFNGLGSLHFSEGYQIKMLEEVTDFQFCETVTGY